MCCSWASLRHDFLEACVAESFCRMSTPPTPNKIFVGGLSWETNDQKVDGAQHQDSYRGHGSRERAVDVPPELSRYKLGLRAYFENFGSVLEAFVSYDRQSGRPRGFGFVVFESAQVAEKVVASKHMIDKREVEAKRAVPKEDNPTPSQPSDAAQRTKKIFVGGLAPSVDEQVLRQYFEAFGQVDDAVVMYDHDNKRPRGFGFITFTEEESVDKVFAHGAMQIIHDKHIEIKPAVPKDQMAQQPRRAPPFYSGRSISAAAAAAAASNFAARPPYGFRQGLQTPYTQRPYPQGVPSPRAPITGSIGPAGYGSSSPQGRAAGGPAGAAYGSGIAVQYAPQVPGPASRYSASGMAGAGSSRGFPGVSGQQFGARMYGGLGFGAGDAGLVQPGSSPVGGMYITQLQQLQQQQQQQQQLINGYPGQLGHMDISKLGPLTGQPAAAAAAAAAAAMAAKGYVQSGGVGAGAVGGFPAFQPGQQQFAQQPDPTAYQAEHAAAAVYADPVAHLPGTSPLGTTPEFATFGAGAAAAWGT